MKTYRTLFVLSVLLCAGVLGFARGGSARGHARAETRMLLAEGFTSLVVDCVHCSVCGVGGVGGHATAPGDSTAQYDSDAGDPEHDGAHGCKEGGCHPTNPECPGWDGDSNGTSPGGPGGDDALATALEGVRKAILAGDAAQARRIADLHGRLTYVRTRHAVQIDGCRGEPIGHLPLP